MYQGSQLKAQQPLAARHNDDGARAAETKQDGKHLLLLIALWFPAETAQRGEEGWGDGAGLSEFVGAETFCPPVN